MSSRGTSQPHMDIPVSFCVVIVVLMTSEPPAACSLAGRFEALRFQTQRGDCALPPPPSLCAPTCVLLAPSVRVLTFLTHAGTKKASDRERSLLGSLFIQFQRVFF